MQRTKLNLAGSSNGYVRPRPASAQSVLPPATLRRLADSLKGQWKRYRKGLKRSQKKFSESAVHESRVQTRRLLAMMELLKPFLAAGRVKKVQASLKRHLDTFDGLRDTQVQLLAVENLCGDFPAAKIFYEYLEKRERRLARQTLKQIKRIKTRPLAKLMGACRADLKRWREGNSPERANRLLLGSVESAFARTRQFKDKIQRSRTATIHRTRVAFKRFRYMVEILAEHLPWADKKLLAAMHDYQTMMGNIQDVEVLLRDWNDFLRRKPVPSGIARPLSRELSRRRQELIGLYIEASDQLYDFLPALPQARPRVPRQSSRGGTPQAGPAAAP